MASLFGSVATEFGGTLKDMAQDKREERLANEEAQREMQLQKMRMQHDSSLLDKRISADDKREQSRQDAQRSLEEFRVQSESEAAAAERTHEMSIEQLRAETDLIEEAMKQYFSKTRTRTMSGNGFTMSNEPRQIITPDGISYEDNWSGTAPNGQPLSVKGDKIFYGGDDEAKAWQFESVDQQRLAEQELLKGEVNSQQFYDVFGYLPRSYVFGQVSRDDPNFQQWAERNNIRFPAWYYAPGDRRGGGSKRGTGESPESRELRPKMEDDYVYPPAAPMQPSIEELSEGPARDANIAAKGGTNEELAAKMRAEAQGGRLSQAEQLTQGGQLEKPTAETQAIADKYGVELDDQGAAEIAQSVSGGLSPQGERLKQDVEQYGYGGVAQ